MKRLAVILSLVATLGIASIAQAQATRTWVSGVGDDVNPCSRTAPCKTFAGAISKTATGGEIDVLDPGGFGGVTITKSIKIDGGPFAGGVLTAGTSGVVVNATTSSTITLRNLSINGTNSVGTLHGIRILAAKSVVVDHCEIYNYGSRGISVETSASTNVIVNDTTIRNNVSSGIVSAPTAGNPRLTVNNSKIFLNGAHGIDIVSLTDAHINGSTMSDNTSAGFITEQSSNTAAIESCFIANNATGIQAGLSGQSPAVFLSRSMVIRNLTQGIVANGTVLGFQNNVIANNAGNNSVSSSTAQQ